MTETGVPPDDDMTTEQGEWLAPKDAAARLGVSERTLYRQLAAGRLRKRIGPDSRPLVLVPLTARQAASDSGRQAAEEQAERAVALLERANAMVAQQVAPLLAELSAMRQQLTELAEDRGRLSAENAHLRARVTELEARQLLHDERIAAVSQPTGKTPDGDSLPVSGSRRRWWWPFG
jgi:septal ring factor EnvC (AmiA/AmiB activator)